MKARTSRQRSQALQPITRERKGPRWGQAHEQRGLNYADHAIALYKTFGLGNKFSSEQFDTWMQTQGLLQVPNSTDKSADTWKAHVRRRDHYIPKLRDAGRHPRMRDESGLPTFNLVFLGLGEWILQPPQEVVHDRPFLQQIRAYIETRKRELDHLLQGVDFSQLPFFEFAMAEALYDDIDLLETMNSQHITSINSKLTRIQHKVEEMLRRGQAPLRLPE